MNLDRGLMILSDDAHHGKRGEDVTRTTEDKKVYEKKVHQSAASS
jgi:hypothetical protein